jgi:hypothetical protein
VRITWIGFSMERCWILRLTAQLVYSYSYVVVDDVVIVSSARIILLGGCLIHLQGWSHWWTCKLLFLSFCITFFICFQLLHSEITYDISFLFFFFFIFYVQCNAVGLATINFLERYPIILNIGKTLQNCESFVHFSFLIKKWFCRDF